MEIQLHKPEPYKIARIPIRDYLFLVVCKKGRPIMYCFADENTVEPKPNYTFCWHYLSRTNSLSFRYKVCNTFGLSVPTARFMNSGPFLEKDKKFILSLWPNSRFTNKGRP